MSVLHEFLVQLGDNAVNGQEAGNGASAGAKRRGIVQTRTKRVLVRSESSAATAPAMLLVALVAMPPLSEHVD